MKKTDIKKVYEFLNAAKTVYARTKNTRGLSALHGMYRIQSVPLSLCFDIINKQTITIEDAKMYLQRRTEYNRAKNQELSGKAKNDGNLFIACKNCGKEKPVSEFYVKRGSRNGFQSWCKDCTREHGKNHVKATKKHGSFYKKKKVGLRVRFLMLLKNILEKRINKLNNNI